ncbi:MAG: DUF3343 domain-containing protein [Firmicutes bacterium]|nr:DUF3343 domain-containing protein [Bacillota bacterium]
MTVIGVFRSRNQTLKFAELLDYNGVNYRVINTPREAQAGCGISVEIARYDADAARSLLDKSRFPSFHGWFEFVLVGCRRVFRKYTF